MRPQEIEDLLMPTRLIPQVTIRLIHINLPTDSSGRVVQCSE
ncbi:MAG: hypothetical protein ACJAUH_002893 [Saprospiraceae bacterium]|jgi:hypothetical protein